MDNSTSDRHPDRRFGSEAGRPECGTVLQRQPGQCASRRVLASSRSYAELDAAAAIDVWYARPREEPRRVVGAILSERKQHRGQGGRARGLLGDRWIGPHQLRSPAATSEGGEQAPERAFRVPTRIACSSVGYTKRYLWLKLQLSAWRPAGEGSGP